MSTIIGGSSPSVTFPDSTVQDTSAIVGGKVPYANLPVGSVLQVVNTVTNTFQSVTSTSYVDTYITASITPKSASNKVLVAITMNGINAASGTVSAEYVLNVCDGSNNQIYMFQNTEAGNYNLVGTSVCFNFLHSPATTSSFTYKVRVRVASTGIYISNNYGTGYPYNSITLTEIVG